MPIMEEEIVVSEVAASSIPSETRARQEKVDQFGTKWFFDESLQQWVPQMDQIEMDTVPEIPQEMVAKTKAKQLAMGDDMSIPDSSSSAAISGSQKTDVDAEGQEPDESEERIADCQVNAIKKKMNKGKKKPSVAETEEEKEAKRIAREHIKKEMKAVKSIYATGLPHDVTERELADFFGKCGILRKDPVTGMINGIKIYQDDDGRCKGDALITYFRSESVDLALEILDGADVRHNYPIKIEKAKFEGKKRKKKQKVKGKASTTKKARINQLDELSWEEDSRKNVIVKNMFIPEDGWTDINFFKELKEDIKEECEGRGWSVHSIKCFEHNPEGVVAIKLNEPWAAQRCVEVMNGRFFAGRELEAEFYDNITNYHVEESEEAKELRNKKWQEWLEQQSSSDEEDVVPGAQPQAQGRATSGVDTFE